MDTFVLTGTVYTFGKREKLNMTFIMWMKIVESTWCLLLLKKHEPHIVVYNILQVILVFTYELNLMAFFSFRESS